jgi:hypothetical protein
VNAVLDREYAQRRAKLLWKKAIAKVIFLNRCSLLIVQSINSAVY